MTRTFIAIELGDDVRSYLMRQVSRLRATLPGVHWADADSLHLTLAFLGELDDDRLALARDATAEAAEATAPFSLRVAGLGTFGRPTAPTVIWARVDGDLDRLHQLHAALRGALVARSIAAEARAYSPHVTLARVRAPLPPAQVALLAERGRAPNPHRRARRSGAALAADELSVMRSELARPVARYARLYAFALGGTAASETT